MGVRWSCMRLRRPEGARRLARRLLLLREALDLKALYNEREQRQPGGARGCGPAGPVAVMA